MAKQSRISGRRRNDSLVTRLVTSVFEFVKFAEFEIFFILFFIIAFLLFKNLTARPEYNQLLVKKPGGMDWWPYQ